MSIPNTYPHLHADTIDCFKPEQKVTRAHVAYHGYCAFLQGGAFCCSKKKTQGKFCDKHANFIARKEEPVAEETFPHARYDEIGILPGNYKRLQIFENGYCGYLENRRFCCAQPLSREEIANGHRLCVEHNKKIQRGRDERKKVQEDRQKKYLQRKKVEEEEREEKNLEQLAASFVLAQDLPDTPEFRMELAKTFRGMV